MNLLPEIGSLTAADIAKIKEFSKFAWQAVPDRLRKEIKDFTSSKWNTVAWALKAEEYFTRLYERVGSTRLMGHAKEIRVSDIFTDVYIYNSPLASKKRSIQGNNADALRQKKLEDEADRLPATEVLREHRIYLSGKPGAGKTTLLRYLAIQSCDAKRPSTPIYVALKDLAENVNDPAKIDLIQHIVAQFQPCELPNTALFVNELFESGQATLMLDGLDEVTEKLGIRAALINQTKQVATRYPNLKIIITCRVGANFYTFEQFATAQIADFSPQQQVQFVKKWYKNDSYILNSFLEQWALPQNSGLRDLASTPLLLTLLCITFDETREFPPRRGDLYREAVEALLRKWSISRGIARDNPYRALTATRKEQMLSFIAYKFFRNGHVIFSEDSIRTSIGEYLSSLPKQEIGGDMEPVDILNQIEANHGLITHETSDYLAFSHLTIQEYFTARYLIESSNEKILKKELSFANITDRRWQEVILLAISSVSSADYILSLIRSEINQALYSEPSFKNIIFKIATIENVAAEDVWGHVASSTASQTRLRKRKLAPETQLGRQLVSSSDVIERSILAASFSPAVTRRAHLFRKNLLAGHLIHAETYFSDAAPTRTRKFADIIYAEELYAQGLAIGTINNRNEIESMALSYE